MAPPATIDVLCEARHLEDYLVPQWARDEWDGAALQDLEPALDLRRLSALVDELLELDSLSGRDAAPVELRAGFLPEREADPSTVEELATQVATLNRAAARFFTRTPRERLKVIIAETPIFREAGDPRVDDALIYTSFSMPDAIPHTSAEADLPLLARFRNVRVLILFGNNLETLPVDCRSLQALRAIDLAGNRFASIPACVLDGAALEWLDLSQNPISRAPDELRKLPALRYLGLRGTALSAAELDRLRASLPSCDIDA